MKDSRELNKNTTDMNSNIDTKKQNQDPAFDPAKFNGGMTNPFFPFFPDLASLFGKTNND